MERRDFAINKYMQQSRLTSSHSQGNCVCGQIEYHRKHMQIIDQVSNIGFKTTISFEEMFYNP